MQIASLAAELERKRSSQEVPSVTVKEQVGGPRGNAALRNQLSGLTHGLQSGDVSDADVLLYNRVCDVLCFLFFVSWLN